MGRNIDRLRAFIDADELVLDVYKCTAPFPQEERYGLQMQLRRAALSVPTNLVEGGERRTTRDFLQFVCIALGSASEARHLISVARRLGFLDHTTAVALEFRYTAVVRALQKLLHSLETAP